MSNQEIQKDYKRIVKHMLNNNGYKVYIKDIKKVIAAKSGFAYGIAHKVKYTVIMKTGVIYELNVETQKDGSYNEQSAHFTVTSVNIIN